MIMVDSNIDIQKRLEKEAINNIRPYIEERLGIVLTDITNAYYCERPDFIFKNEQGESIGVEVVECHPSVQKNKKENRARRKGFQKKVSEIVASSKIIEDISKDQKYNIIINRYRFDDCVDAEGNIVKLTPKIFAEEVLEMLYFWNSEHKFHPTHHIKSIKMLKAATKNIVQFNNITGRRPIEWKYIENSIKEKNGKYKGYKDENNCSEFWLCIYIPFEESLLSNEIEYGNVQGDTVQSFLNSSPFKHIFLTSVMPCDVKLLK